MDEEESWKNIVDFNKYDVSTLGRIRNKKSKYVLKNNTKSDYDKILLFLTGSTKRKQRAIHIHVALTFLGNPPKKNMVVNHKDGNKRNNRLSNLEWTTRSKNSKLAHENGLITTYKRKIFKYDIETDELIQTYESIQKAADEIGQKIQTLQYHGCKEDGGIFKGFRWRCEEIEESEIIPNEKWKQYKETNYLVSDHARVQNKIRKIFNVIKPVIVNDYYNICLSSVGTFKLNRLVAEVWIENPYNLPVVDHIDGNKLNDHVSNLRWVTALDNVRSAVAKKIDQFDLNGDLIKTWECMAEIPGNPRFILECLRGTRKTVKGFVWKYTDPNTEISTYTPTGRGKPIIQLNLDGSLVKNWPNIITAETELKLKTISRCLNGKQKTAGGFLWKFKK